MIWLTLRWPLPKCSQKSNKGNGDTEKGRSASTQIDPQVSDGDYIYQVHSSSVEVPRHMVLMVLILLIERQRCAASVFRNFHPHLQSSIPHDKTDVDESENAFTS